ncbi:MAG: non-ribosomal peptide synthetase, partial [Cytophagales bacterium]|nr:non-ribosomal peptide synthetase [Cytophagales bacterium]
MINDFDHTPQAGDAPTLIAYLHRVRRVEDKGVTFIQSGTESRFMSYQKLYAEALRTLGGFQAQGVRAGDEIVFQLEEEAQFLVAFWACLLGGMLPVPLSVGAQPGHKQKVFEVWRTLTNPFLLGDEASRERLRTYAGKSGQEPLFAAINGRMLEAGQPAAPGQPAAIHPGAVAYIQYSSGSTGEPKGVILTHENLVANTSDIAARSAITARDALLSWMPLTHDMGLICFHLTGVLAGVNQYIIPTALFIRRPTLWLEKASEYRATVLYSPNFGYQYFLAALRNPRDYPWDLSPVRLIYNGAEPISAALCGRFLHELKGFGLKDSVFFPGYGLAEASVAVTLPEVNSAMVSYALDRALLKVGDCVRDVPPAHPSAVSFVEVGFPIDHCRVRIAGAADEPLAENHVGHILIRGANVTSGYYNRPGLTAQLFTAENWLRTGDLGFLRDGKLVVTGRQKNVIIINGQNYYPQDIERIAQDVDQVELGSVAACGISNGNTDELVLFFLAKQVNNAFFRVAAEIRKKVEEKTGLVVGQVVAVRKIPKTTSGKTQYFKLKEDYLNGAFAGAEAVLPAVAGKEGASVPETLLGILRDVLNGEPVGPEENFFRHGINSLKAVQIQSRINDRYRAGLSRNGRASSRSRSSA